MREKLIDKLNKMKVHMESARAIGSEAEAQAFAEAIQRLLIEHEISMSEVDAATRDVEEPIDETYVDFRKHGLEPKRQRQQWAEWLADVVATAHSCRILISKGTNMVWFVGRRSDREICEFLFVTLLRSAESIADVAYNAYCHELLKVCHCGCSKALHKPKGGGAIVKGESLCAEYFRCGCRGFKPHVERARGFRGGFLVGFVSRIRERFVETRRSVAPTASTALIRLDQQLVRVQDWVTAKYGKPKGAALSAPKAGAGTLEGRRRGKAAADAAGLRANAMGARQTTEPRRLR